MKVLLRRNVFNVGEIGDVVDVKPGFARNYLLPQGIAYVPSEANIKAVEKEKEAYLKELARQRQELEARCAVVDGKEVTITARANPHGHLYGSVGPAQIVAALAGEGIFVEPKNILLSEPIRQLDKYELTVRFAEDIEASINVWVVPSADSDQPAPPEEAAAAGEQVEGAAEGEGAGEQSAESAGEPAAAGESPETIEE